MLECNQTFVSGVDGEGKERRRRGVEKMRKQGNKTS
jgi:hypothetical protein